MAARHPRDSARFGSARLFVALALFALTPAVASAQMKTPAATSELGQLQNECARLRAELDRANAEVASLKRSDRGFRNDYRLRQKLADAEALARRLTEAESHLRSRTANFVTPRQSLLATPPVATPADGPVELEAKADLLTDQARRLSVEADTLSVRAGQLRDRQMLRRRSLQLERDPFVGVETSKRSMVLGTTRSSADVSKSGASGPGADPTQLDRGTSTPAPGGSQTSPQMPSPPPATTAPVSGTPGSTTGGTPPPAMGTPASPPGGTSTPTTGTAPGTPTPTSAVSSQVRTLLDPATLLQVQRLERSGKPLSDVDALEKAAAALRQRAQSLDAQAKSLRARSGR